MDVRGMIDRGMKIFGMPKVLTADFFVKRGRSCAWGGAFSCERPWKDLVVAISGYVSAHHFQCLSSIYESLAYQDNPEASYLVNSKATVHDATTPPRQTVGYSYRFRRFSKGKCKLFEINVLQHCMAQTEAVFSEKRRQTLHSCIQTDFRDLFLPSLHCCASCSWITPCKWLD